MVLADAQYIVIHVFKLKNFNLEDKLLVDHGWFFC